MDFSSELIPKGWHLSSAGLEMCKEGLDRPTVAGIINKALDIDLKEIGGSCFPEDVSRGKLDYITGPGVVQIQKIKNATAPKYEYGSGAPPILRLLLTDGTAFVNCLQWGQWKSITMDTPPGTKLYLKPGKIAMQNNFMLLNENQFTVLGGCVAHMVDKWDLCRRLASHVRTKGDLDSSGPPPWIPFGKPINAVKQPMKGKNFRALETENKEVKEEDEAFKQQRLANIAEVARVKEGKPKVFGGGKDVKQANSRAESGNFSHFVHSNSNDSLTYSKVQRNFNEYENSPRKQNNDKYMKNNRNGRSWSNQDVQRTQAPPDNFTQGPSYMKDKRTDQRNKFNANEFQNTRNQGTYQQKSFNNNTYRGNDGANSSKRFSKNSNFYESSKASSERYCGNDKSGDVEDVSQRMSQVKLHGYDSRNESSVVVPNKPFLKPGIEVMAKYWEDNKFYPALIHAVGAEGKTCVVRFLEYDNNYEEVLVNDVQEIHSAWNAGPFSFQPSHWDSRDRGHDFRYSSEFQDNSHRSQGRGRHDRQKTPRQDFRPSTKLYQPPQQRQTS